MSMLACRVWAAGILLAWFAAGCSKPVVPPSPPAVNTASLDKPLVTLIETSRQAVVEAPRSANAWGRLGQALHAVDFLAEASVCYTVAADLDSRAARWPHLLGLIQLQDQPDAAIANFARAVKLTGTDPDAPTVALARALVERGRLDEAAKRLKPLLKASPQHAAARLEMARVHLGRNELEHAKEALVASATNYYTTRPALLLLAQIHQRQGRAEQAADFTRRALAMPRQFDWPDPWWRETTALRVDRQKLADQVNGLLLQQRLQDAEAVLNRLLNVFPDDGEGLLLLGRMRMLEQRLPEAEETLRRHLAAQPASLNGLVQLGICLLRQQRWPDAALVLRQAVSLKPDFAQGHYNLGFALSRHGDHLGAIACFQDALRASPGDANTHLALADEYSRAGRLAEALDHVNRAGELNPGDQRVKQLKAMLEKK